MLKIRRLCVAALCRVPDVNQAAIPWWSYDE